MRPDNDAPEIILTWLETRSFSALTDMERNTVLSHFSQEEYDGMRLAMSSLVTKDHSKRKMTVMETFEMHHRGKIRPLPGAWIWKAAAVLMPAVMLTAFYFLKQRGDDFTRSTVHVTDTVFIRSEVVGPTEIVYDTVYLVRYRNKKDPSKASMPNIEEKAQQTAFEDMQGLSISEFENIDAVNKGVSLEEDTLWKRFDPATL